MDLILNNPYRTVGLLAGATAREQNRQIKRLKQYIAAEQKPEDGYSFPVLGPLPRTLANVESAEARLNLNSDKMEAALFWFWNGNPITDEAAFEALKDGDVDRAYEIWEKLTTKIGEDGKRSWMGITSKNHSAFHNLAVLRLASWRNMSFGIITKPDELRNNLPDAIAGNLISLESDLVSDFIAMTGDSTYKPSKKALQLLFLERLYPEFKDKERKNEARQKILPKILPILSHDHESLLEFMENDGKPKKAEKTYPDEFIKAVKKIDFSAKWDFLHGVVAKLIEQTERFVEDTKTKRKADKINCAIAANALYKNTVELIKEIKAITSASDVKYASIADKVANEITQCSIDYFNLHQKEHDQSYYVEKESMDLAKKAKEIAVGSLVKNRIEHTIGIVATKMANSEISRAIDTLEHIKEEDRKCEESWKRAFKRISLGLDYKSLNWDNVVKTIHEAIPRHHVEKIKNSNETRKLKEYREAVEFFFKSVIPSDEIRKRRKVAYINYWGTVPKASVKEEVSESVSESFSDGCLGQLVGFIVSIIIGIGIIWFLTEVVFK